MNILTGLCVCPGLVKGRIKFYREGVTYTKDDIVVLNQWLTQGVFLLRNAGGLLSTHGGLTCHASILSREFNIPCLVSVHGLDDVPESQLVELDAANEEVRSL
ncbi:hypothetical protein HYY69_06020 [Candidatus Woesearchaeota archaeon]|nr:hypothetical protein [Candidatus Woesearchaeota archaeon]